MTTTERDELDSFESFLRFLRPRWQLDALCAEYPSVNFFPERGEPAEPARAVCRSCLVREDCLRYALELGTKHGIWGGLSERERRRVRQAEKVAA